MTGWESDTWGGPATKRPSAIVTLSADVTEEQLAAIRAALGPDCTVRRELPDSWTRVSGVST